MGGAPIACCCWSYPTGAGGGAWVYPTDGGAGGPPVAPPPNPPPPCNEGTEIKSKITLILHKICSGSEAGGKIGGNFWLHKRTLDLY